MGITRLSDIWRDLNDSWNMLNRRSPSRGTRCGYTTREVAVEMEAFLKQWREYMADYNKNKSEYTMPSQGELMEFLGQEMME